MRHTSAKTMRIAGALCAGRLPAWPSRLPIRRRRRGSTTTTRCGRSRSATSPTITRFEPDLFYDSVENIFTKPGDTDFDKRAENVNTVDEVMDGAWFTNRAGTLPADARKTSRAPRTPATGPAPGKWTVVSAKSDGVTPGFTIRDANEDLWFLKFDPPGYRGMSTGHGGRRGQAGVGARLPHRRVPHRPDEAVGPRDRGERQVRVPRRRKSGRCGRRISTG